MRVGACCTISQTFLKVRGLPDQREKRKGGKGRERGGGGGLYRPQQPCYGLIPGPMLRSIGVNWDRREVQRGKEKKKVGSVDLEIILLFRCSIDKEPGGGKKRVLGKEKGGEEIYQLISSDYPWSGQGSLKKKKGERKGGRLCGSLDILLCEVYR